MTSTDPSAQHFQQAQAITQARFHYWKDDQPASDILREICVETTAQALAQGQTVAPPTPAATEPVLPNLSVDPFSMLRGEIALPSLPTVYAELQDIIADENASASDVAEIISKDTGLAAFLLRLVNSAFYSFPSQIDTISRAVTVVGISQLSTLASGTTVMQMFDDMPQDLLDINSFWEHSITTGILARALAKRLGRDNPERFFVAGLLHDVGRLAIVRALPQKAVQVLTFARDNGLLLHRCEKGMLGFDHATLGGMLLRKWNLPFPLVNAVLHHHAPNKSKEGLGPSLLHVANILAAVSDLGSSGEHYIQPINPEAWDATGLRDEDLSAVVKGCVPQIESAVQALLEG